MNYSYLKIITVMIATILCLLPRIILANQHAGDVLVPLPSINDFTRGEDGLGAALGAGLEYENPYFSEDFEFELEPVVDIHWRDGNNVFFLEDASLGWRGLRREQWLLQASVAYEPGLEPEGGDLTGIAKRDSHIAVFFETRWALGDNWRNWIGGRLGTGTHSFGAFVTIAAGHRFGEQNDNSGSEVFVFATFGTDDFMNKDFGVTAADAENSDFLQTELSGGFRSIGVSALDRYYLTENIQLITQAGAEFYSGSVQDSPIVQHNFELEASFSVLWQF